MAWDLDEHGSWGIATTDSPATDLAAALALPGSWRMGQQPTVYVRKDQWPYFNKLSPVDADFEDGSIGSYGGAYQCTLANTTAQAHTGSHALRATATAATGGYFSCNTYFPVRAGHQYRAQCWVKASVNGRQAFLTIAFFDAGYGYVSQVPGAAVTLTSAAWTYVPTAYCTAPPGAAYVLMYPNFASGAAGDLFDWDTFVVF